VKSSLRLGKIFGIPIGVNYTWFIVFVLVTLSLATSYFPARYADWGLVGYLVTGLLASLLFFASVLLHELAHSVVARAWGIQVKSITLFIFGGVANIGREPDRPLAEFLVAIAGPLASLLLINLWLALFNMIPGYPLDGGRVFRSAIWAKTGDMNKATRWAAQTGRGIAMLMIIGGGLMILTGNWSNGLWLAFIGWFLDNAASQGLQSAWMREALHGYTAADFATSTCQTVDSNMPLDWLVRDYVLPGGRDCFVVTEGERPQGVVTLAQIRAVPQQRWAWTPVRQIMTPLSSLNPVRADEAAYSVLERMVSEGQRLLPVMDNGRLMGLVQQENLLRFAQMRTSLGV